MKVRNVPTILVSLLVSFGLLLLGSPTAMAGTPDCSFGDLSEETSAPVVSGMRASLDTALQQGSIALTPSKSVLDFENSRALVSEKDDQIRYRMFTVPIGGSFEVPSNLTVVFSAEGELLAYSETLISLVSQNVYWVQIINDGKVAADTRVDVSKVSESQVQAAYKQASAAAGGATVMAGGGAGTVAACLASVLGIGGAVGWVIAGACAGSCSVPITPVTGPVCAACIGGFAVLGGASVGAAAACFQLL